MRTWQFIVATMDIEAQELLSSLLFDLGATGIITLDETPGRVTLGAYFHQQAEPERIIGTIQNALDEAGNRGMLHSLTSSTVPDEDWMQKWKEGFEPTAIGQRLLISPSWKLPGTGVDGEDTRQSCAGRIVIQIDPGMAFGTGTHETTRMCLEALERHWHGGRLLDVGTGTGILGIAAAKLSPGSRITMIDNDPEAIVIAKENTAINGVLDSAEISCAEVRDQPGGSFDVVVANLTAEVILDLMADLVKCLKPGGRLILSGILSELAQGVRQEVARSGVEVIEDKRAGEWVAIVGQEALLDLVYN